MANAIGCVKRGYCSGPVGRVGCRCDGTGFLGNGVGGEWLGSRIPLDGGT